MATEPDPPGDLDPAPFRVVAESMPHFPGGPDPAEPVPRAPVDGVDLDAYARIAATLAERAAPRASILAQHGLDELRWVDVEKTWLLRVAASALRGDVSLAEDLDRATLSAQAALGPTEPTRPLDEYAAICARVESGADVALVLADARLSLGDWARLQRAWTARLVLDPALAVTFRELVARPR
jgi:hypothetical protein